LADERQPGNHHKGITLMHRDAPPPMQIWALTGRQLIQHNQALYSSPNLMVGVPATHQSGRQGQGATYNHKE